MTFRGTILNGKVELEAGADLPDGTIVRVEAVPPARKRRGTVRKTAPNRVDPAYRIGELAVPTGIRDLAAEHDHYIYGTPKRSARRSKRRSKRS